MFMELSVLEVSLTGDRDGLEEIQPFALMARVGGFLWEVSALCPKTNSWPQTRRLRTGRPDQRPTSDRLPSRTGGRMRSARAARSASRRAPLPNGAQRHQSADQRERDQLGDRTPT